ncbi:MAG TPA: hypothetical protein VJ841_01270 [Candidatus Saccharimonadales bacterium]|nr:hypothetical protein [Candidatus Saccharimonadales bacterium]
MDKKEVSTFKNFGSRKRNIIIVVTLLVVALLIALLFQIVKPDRSVASYCKVYKEEAAKLDKAQGDTYSVAVFSHSSSNPADFANAFSKLEQVAPNDIQPDVKTLQQLFEKINNDPSQSMSASLSGLGAESSVKDWTSQNCHL